MDFDKNRDVFSILSMTDYRCYKSDGQLSISDTARSCGAIRYNKFGWNLPDTRLIRKLASDLAYPYVDNAGRLLMFFAWGDLEEISRRVAYYRTKYPLRINPNPIPYEPKTEPNMTSEIYDDIDIPF